MSASRDFYAEGPGRDLWLEAHAACDGDRDRMWEWVADRYFGVVEQLETLREKHNELTFAAMHLCNVHRWSYGGPETLRALAERRREAAKRTVELHRRVEDEVLNQTRRA